MIPKILPARPGRPDERGWLTAEQEAAIVRTIDEFTTGTKAAVWGSNMDTGKTVQATEVVVRMGLERVLYIGIKDTFKQWHDRLEAQSDGQLVLRRMDASVAGRAAWDAFYAGEPGHYFVGSQYLLAQDWDHVPAFDRDGRTPLYKRTPKSKGWEIIFDERPEGEIGPALIPKRASVRVHRKIFSRAGIKKHPLDLVVFDEVHVMANRKSVGRKTVSSIPTKRKLAMSGTWYGNKFENAWSITRWAWPEHVDASFHRWAEVWCGTSEVYLPGGVKSTVLTGEKMEGSFVQTLPCYIRIDGELEVPKPEIVYVDLTPAQRADYDVLEADMLVWLNSVNGQRATLVADIPIVLRTHLRTATLGVMSIDDVEGIYFAPDTQSTKLAALRKIVDRPDWSGRPVAIYTHSKRFAKIIVARMRAAGYDAHEWSGDVSSKKRDEIKAKFLRGEIPYLVCVITSFSTGLDGFQAVCNRVVWVSEEDNNIQNQQAIKRFYRSGFPELLADFQHVSIQARDTHDAGIYGKNVAETLAARNTMSIAA